MDVLSKLENALERAVEGVFARTFRARVHPVEIAKRLAREMDANRTVSVATAYMPNRFRVGLSARDHAEFERVREVVLPDLCAYLTEHARRSGCTLPGAIEIRVDADHGLAAGEIRVESAMAAGGTEPGTATLPLPEVDAQPTQQMTIPARLVADDGAEITLDRPVTRIGRAPDNDVVLADRAVSRHHAEVRREGDGFAVADVGSTNGTYCNGDRIESAPLHDGDRLQVGPLTLTFRSG
jgi:hypothetical protein